VKNISEVLSDECMDSGKIGQVIAELKALPLAGREKVDLLQAWSRAVGAKVSSSQYSTVEASGIDNR
jgi:hypothetical protein